jgi:hypothetical protein
MRHTIIAILALAFLATSAGAAEGRRTAAIGGFLVGALTGYVVRDAMEVRPAPQTVYVESQPRVVYVERPAPVAPQVVYVESAPRVVYVERPAPAPRVTVYVEIHNGGCASGWTPPPAVPFDR